MFPHQQLCIHYLLAAAGYFGVDNEHNSGLFVSLPTGSGKSLCFMAPAGLLSGFTIIFYPLNALLRDQKRRFESAGVQTILYYGGMEREERLATLSALEKIDSGVILTNIESAVSAPFQEKIHRKKVQFMVIDEGHLILQWGRSFRPSLLKIFELRKSLGNPLTGVFTATITESDRLSLAELLWPDGDWDYFELLSDRTNISYRILPCLNEVTALRLLLRQTLDRTFALLNPHPEVSKELKFPMLIFVPRRQDCEMLARQATIWLRLWNRSDITVWYYHAGLSSAERKAIERDYADCESGLLFTTKAFGTGVDIAGIRSTIHFCEPETMEDFLQESGRAGRDGEPAFSYVLQREPKLFLEKGCRRRQALKQLGQDPPYCSGCDYCEKIPWRMPVEEVALRELRKINRLRLSPAEEYRLIRYEDFADMKPKAYQRIGK